MTRRVCNGGVTVLLVGLAFVGCTGKSPSEPTPAAKAPTPNIAVSTVFVEAGSLSAGGYLYRVTVKLLETGGAAATIPSIELTFLNGTTPLASLRSDNPISDESNQVAANATVESRELTTTDTDFSHPAATNVVARVTFTDGGATTGSASGSAEIPPPAPALLTLSGNVSNEENARMVSGGTVQILDGPNAGKSSLTDGGGAYSISGLTGGSFMVRATANGYVSREQSVSIARDMQLDLTLRPVPGPTSPPPAPSPCAYTISPTSNSIPFQGGSFAATVTRTSGTCTFQAASDANWLTVNPTSGDGTTGVSYVALQNVGLQPTGTRSGNITISWTGGSVTLRVIQGGASLQCVYTISTGTQDLGNVPAAGGQYTITLTRTDTGPVYPPCTGVTSSSQSWITVGPLPPAIPLGPGTVTFSVAANPSPGTSRTGTVFLTGPGLSASIIVTQR